MARVPGRNNPMFSGIAVIGKKEDQLAKYEGVGRCRPINSNTRLTPTPKPSCRFDFSYEHDVYQKADKVANPRPIEFNASLNEKPLRLFRAKHNGFRQTNPYWQAHKYEFSFIAKMDPFVREGQKLRFQPLGWIGFHGFGAIMNANFGFWTIRDVPRIVVIVHGVIYGVLFV